MLKTVSWEIVVLDEAQAIKNPDAQRTLAAKAMKRKCGIAVTGTPLENSLMDLWSVTDFAVPGYLGDRSAYEGDDGQDLEIAVAAEPLVRPLLLRRRLEDVSLELPPLVDMPQALLMYDEEAWGYETLRRMAEGNGPAIAALTPLRQYCSHPSLVTQHLGPSTPDSAKLNRLIAILAEVRAQGEKAIVFAPYTGAIDLIVAVIGRSLSMPARSVDGRTPMPARHEIIDEFNSARDSRVLVLNPAAAGTGLNITGANHVIHYSLEWNPAKVDQATARAYRKGQERPVTVHQLYYTGTVEETIVDRLARKRSLASAAVTGTDGLESDTSDVLRALSLSPVHGEIE
jgi:SNF2 family DNA or RNA helicase